MEKKNWVIIIIGAIIFWAFLAYINKSALGYDNPINDPVIIYGFLFVGLPTISGFMFYQNLKIISRKFIVKGIPGGFTMDTGNPLGIIPEDIDGGYPEYYVFEMGGVYSRLKYFAKPGGEDNGIFVVDSNLVDDYEGDKVCRANDAEMFKSKESKDAMPPHILEWIQKRYEREGRGYNPEWPIFWAEVGDDPKEVKTYSGILKRTKNLQKELADMRRQRDSWKQAAQAAMNYKPENRYEQVISRMGRVMDRGGPPRDDYNEEERGYERRYSRR